MARHAWSGLDGLRGVAVAAVVLFHASEGWAVNGYAGVDVFFVLSGFLITWLLVDERRASGRIDLGSFYLRRLLRLYPALVLACVAVLSLGLAAGDVSPVLPGVLAALLYAANWWQYTGHDASLLEHTWTLALEEHFYLVWPVLVACTSARSTRLRATGIVLGLLGLAVFLAPWPSGLDPVRSSYLRATPILFGCALAVLLGRRSPGRAPRRLLAWAAVPALAVLLVIVTTSRRLPDEWMTGARSLPAVLAVVVIAAVVLDPNAWATRMLSLRALTWLGRRSYGIYLYHFPILSIMLHQVPVPANEAVRAALGVGLALAAAATSYRWVEQPLLRLRHRLPTRPRPVLEAGR